MDDKATLKVAGKQVNVTNLNKIFYPKARFTKGEVINYYIKVSSVLLPYLKNRPISLKRYPDGVKGFSFYEKHCPAHRPAWVKTVDIKKSAGDVIKYSLINNLPTLIWAAQLASIELHPFLHKTPALKKPTAVIFDLDPGPPANIRQCCQVALKINSLLTSLGLKSFPKTSGSRGMQIYVPLNSSVTYKQTKTFAHTVAQILEKQFPKKVILQMKKSLRRGKIFIDWSQNDEKKNTISVYSLRAKEHPTVSTPLTWKEVETAVKKKTTLKFEAADVLKRIDKMGDLFAPVLKLKQTL